MTAGNEEYKIEQKLLNNALQISIVDNRNNEYTGLFSKELLSEKEDFLNTFQ